MKQSDIITVVIIAVVGTVAAYFIVNGWLGNPGDASFEFETIEAVSAALVEPDPEVFNEEAINPTIEVYVGECEDVDQNGILDKAELVACGKETAEEGNAERREVEVNEETVEGDGSDESGE